MEPRHPPRINNGLSLTAIFDYPRQDTDCYAGVRGVRRTPTERGPQLGAVTEWLSREHEMTAVATCERCGVQILPATARRTGGLCMPCSTGTREAIERGRRERNQRLRELSDLDEPEDGYQEALRALGAGDLMNARAVTAQTIDAAWSRRRGVKTTIPRLQDLLRKIGDLERRSEPLVVARRLAALLRYCETFCVAGCCGRDAFDQAAVTRWAEESPRATTAEALAELDSLLAHLALREGTGDTRVLWSDVFQEAMTADAWRAYLLTWRHSIQSAFEEVT